jgi:hypothetical protein
LKGKAPFFEEKNDQNNKKSEQKIKIEKKKQKKTSFLKEQFILQKQQRNCTKEKIFVFLFTAKQSTSHVHFFSKKWIQGFSFQK